MRKILTTAMLFVAPMALAACGQKAEEAAPVEEVATETPAEPAAGAMADPAAMPADDKMADDKMATDGKMADDKMTAEPDPKNGPPER
jgi:predicted small lipoprotein YifL